MMKVAPSILSADFCNLATEIDRVCGADWLHLDVMDGMFVPNITIGVPVVRSIRKYTDMFLDVHLMVDKPARFIDDFCEAGADLLSVHLEADTPRGIDAALKAMDSNGVKKGIVLRPITDPKAVLPYLERVDLVLMMTVEPGFGGQKFMAHRLEAIREIRALMDRYHPECELEVDGGIDLNTAKQVAAAGANVLVAGTAVYGADHVEQVIQALRMSGTLKE